MVLPNNRGQRKLRDASEHMGGNIGTVGVVTEYSAISSACPSGVGSVLIVSCGMENAPNPILDAKTVSRASNLLCCPKISL
jgi:hypothetical protein